MSLKCKLITNFDFMLNHNMINFVYQPIVGKDSINMYKSLLDYKTMSDALKANNISFNIQDICNYLELDEKAFFNYLKPLEAINLISKYVEQYKQDEIIIKFNTILNWQEFCNDYRYYNLLQSKLPQFEFEKVKLLFQPMNEIGYINNSATFEEVFKLNTKFSLNFDMFYNYLFQTTNKLIVISNDNKTILDNAFVKYSLNYNDLIGLINQSLIKNENNEIIIDNKLLAMAIKQKVDQQNIKQFNLNLKINRNKAIFLKNNNISEFKYVIDDYKALNAEHYLSCIQQHSLDNNDINTINTLRKQYHLPDYIINILIDFCIYRNNGRIELNYLTKIALTINRLNINSIEALINHLRNVSLNNNSSHHHDVEGIDW